MLHPVKFKPFLKFYPYGGRRFAEILNIDVPRDRDVSETWEIADHGEEQSVVVNGPHAGKPLRQLMQEFKSELVGEEIWATYGDYFPLLVKFLDCGKRYPAHLHPNDETASAVGLTDRGKSEAWYIVHADEGAGTYCGALPGLTSDRFAEAIARGDAYEGVMKRVPTRAGDTFFVPPQRPHGLDAGNLAFEIQQNSDAGFGWDWAGKVEAGIITPESAAQHKEWAVKYALYEDGPREQTREVTLNENGYDRTFCAACHHFVMERFNIRDAIEFSDLQSRFNTFSLISGAATISGNGESFHIKKGQSFLLPAQVPCRILPTVGPQSSELEILRCYVPNLERDVVTSLRERGVQDEIIAWLGSYGAGNDLLPLLGLPQDLFNVETFSR
jgi:mannose-6-phosphate isomerase